VVNRDCFCIPRDALGVLLVTASNQFNLTYKRCVERCPRDLGYDVIGWD
jgi:hypothetical protein